MINLNNFLLELNAKYKLESPEGISKDITKLIDIVKVQNEVVRYYSYSSQTRNKKALICLCDVEVICQK